MAQNYFLKIFDLGLDGPYADMYNRDNAREKEREMKNLSHQEMMEMAMGFGYDGEPIEAVYDMCDIFKVSEEKREQLIAAYEEGHFDW